MLSFLRILGLLILAFVILGVTLSLVHALLQAFLIVLIIFLVGQLIRNSVTSRSVKK